MPDERIETYINRSGIQGDTAFMLENLNAINDAFNKVNGIKLTLGKDNSFKAATASAAELKKATDALSLAEKEHQKNLQAIAQLQAKQSEADTNVANDRAIAIQQLKQITSEVNASAKAYASEIGSINEAKAAIVQLKLERDKLNLTTQEGIDKQVQLTAQIAEYSTFVKKNTSLTSGAQSAGQSNSTGASAVISANNLAGDEDEAANLKKTGDAVNGLEREEAQAVIQANEWAAAQRAAAIAAEETAAAQKIALSPLEQTAATLIQQRQAIGLNALAQSDLNTALSEGKITRDEWLASMSKSIIVERELKASVSELNKELNLAAKADLANPGSIRDAQANNLQLISERSSITAKPGIATPEDLQRIAELNALIDQNNELIDANSSKLEKQKINIGNYPTAFKVAFATLDDELGKVSAALQNKDLGSKEIADLTAKQGALKNATALVTQEFATTTAQANAYKEAGKQVGQVYGADSELFKTYAAQVATGTTETKKLGDAFNEAGGKTGGFLSGLRGVYSSLRQIAYAIPGIGLAGLIGLLLDPLIALASSALNLDGNLKRLGNTAEETKFKLKQTGDVLDQTAKEVEKAADTVDTLSETFTLAEQGVIKKTEAVKMYNSTMGQVAGVVDTLDEAEKKLADHAQAYIEFTLLKAAAQTALQKAAEQAAKAAIDAAKPSEDFATLGTKLSSFATGILLFSPTVGNNAGLALAKKRQEDQITQDNAQKAELLKIADDFYKKAADLAKENGLLFNAQPLQEQQKAAIDAIQLQIEALTRYENKQNDVAAEDKNTYEIRRQALVNYNNTVAQIINLNAKKNLLGAIGDPLAQSLILAKQQTDLQKAAIDGHNKLEVIDDSYRQRKLTADEQMTEDGLNQVIKSNEAIFKDEHKSLEDRLAAYYNFIAARQQLLDAQKNEKLASVGFSPQEIQDFNNGLKLQIQGKKITNEELEALQIKYNTDSASLTAAGAKQVYEIAISSGKKEIEDLKLLNKLNLNASGADQYNEDVQALNTAYQHKLIGVLEYQAKKKQLDEAFSISQGKAEIDADNKSLAQDQAYEDKKLEQVRQAAQNLINAKETGSQDEIDQNQAVLDALLKDEKENAALILAVRKKLAADTIAYQKAQIKTKEQLDAENLQNEIKLAQTIVSSIGTLVDARYDQEKAQIQSTINAITAKAQTDIAAENASGDSAQEKADKIQVINDRAAAQNAQLAQQQKKIDHDKAVFDKEVAILNVVINTAVAISKVLATPFLIPVIAAIGAVEIATIAASPIPSYKLGAGVNGRPRHPGGPAEVGHGKNELAITPAGEMIYTPSIPTTMNFPKDTVVLPDANAAIDALIYSSFRGLAHPDTPAPDGGLLKATNQLIKENRRLQSIIANKREANLNVTYQGMEKAYRSGKNWMKYVDEKTNW